MNCLECKLKMIEAARPVSNILIQELVFCPRCGYEKLGRIVEAQIEVEYDYYVKIEFNNIGATMKEIACLRKLDKRLSNTSIQKIKVILSDKSSFRLGSYSKTEADFIYQQAIALDLKAKIII